MYLSIICNSRLQKGAAMDLLPEIDKRVSIRTFKDTPVPKEAVERILEAGRLAPSAKNRQPWRFIVIQDKEKREKIKTAAFSQEHVGSAPVIIAGCTTNVDYTMPNGQISYPVDLSIALSYMSLQAVREGLGTCFISTYDESDIKSILSVPYSMRVVLLLLIGEAAETPMRPLRHDTRRVISYDHW
jgi:nitroreductase